MAIKQTSDGPHYWMYEKTGELAVSVKRYFEREPLTSVDMAYLLTYADGWIHWRGWQDGLVPGELEQLHALRREIVSISNDQAPWKVRDELDLWTKHAESLGYEPW